MTLNNLTILQTQEKYPRGNKCIKCKKRFFPISFRLFLSDRLSRRCKICRRNIKNDGIVVEEKYKIHLCK